MTETPNFAGVGSMCYIILKDDLQPDTLTPKEGKAWSKIDVNKSYSISVDVEPSDDVKPFEIPIDRERQLFSYDPLTSEQLHEITGFMPVDVFVECKDGQMQHIGNVDPRNITVRFKTCYVPHFRRRRLHNKYVKKLARFVVIFDPDLIISSRKASHNLNRAIKQLKRKKS